MTATTETFLERDSAIVVRSFLLLVVAATVVAAPLIARPRSGAQSGAPNADLRSREIRADRRVTFRIHAPAATRVSLTGDVVSPRDPVVFTRNDLGVWAGTTGPLDPGLYRYAFVVDGVQTVDPRNPDVGPMQFGVGSLLYVPGSGSEFTDERPVPHGMVTEVFYRSQPLGLDRRMMVYTPAGYEKGGQHYPVLYLLSAGDTHEAWTRSGRAHFILDNLLAERAIVPMVVVMPTPLVYFDDEDRSKPPRRHAISTDPDPANDPFTTDLLRAVVPYVESHFRVRRDRDSRALVGLSMSGVQVLNIGLTHSETFAWLGVMSSGWQPAARDVFVEKNAVGLRNAGRDVRLLWVGWGAAEAGPGGGAPVLKSLFERYGIPVRLSSVPGGHSWFTWRTHLNQIARLLFR